MDALEAAVRDLCGEDMAFLHLLRRAATYTIFNEDSVQTICHNDSRWVPGGVLQAETLPPDFQYAARHCARVVYKPASGGRANSVVFSAPDTRALFAAGEFGIGKNTCDLSLRLEFDHESPSIFVACHGTSSVDGLAMVVTHFLLIGCVIFEKEWYTHNDVCLVQTEGDPLMNKGHDLAYAVKRHCANVALRYRTAACKHCKQVPARRRDGGKCGRCKAVFYCGGACQTADWRRHRLDCKRLRAGVEESVEAVESVVVTRDATSKWFG